MFTLNDTTLDSEQMKCDEFGICGMRIQTATVS